MNSRFVIWGEKWNKLGVILVVFGFALSGWADTFETRDLVGTGWGFSPMGVADFAYQRCHGAIQVADINGDGWKDVVVLGDTSDLGKPSVTVLQGAIGDPDGTLYVGSDLFWYQNDGYGNFLIQPLTLDVAGVEKPAEIFNGKTLAVADIDRDGDDDIVVWCNWDDQSAPAQGLGAGRVAWFENRGIVSLGVPELFVDGRPKFVQHDVVGMNDTFTFDATTFESGNPRGGTLADMDGDGWIDLVVSNYSGTAGDHSSFFWYKNSGLGGANTFKSANGGNIVPVVVNTTNKPYLEPAGISISASDIDNDGDMDLVLSESGGAASDKELTLLRNIGGGKFTKQVLASPFRIWFGAAAIQDLVGNPCKEIVAGGKDAVGWNSPLSVFYANDPGCTVWNQAVLQNTASLNHIWDIKIADFNNDGRPDIAAFWANDSGNPATVTPSGRRSMCPIWINDGTPNPSNWNTIYLEEKQDPPEMNTENNGGLAVADFDGDGDMDVIRAHVETSLAYFENTYNTERFFKLETIAKRNGIEQKMTTVHATRPDRSFGPLIGQKVDNK
jgi:hypothetical protein